MQFTGRNLELVESGLIHAISDMQMHIGSCPDVFEYAEDLAELEQEKQLYLDLLGRVQAALRKEKNEL